MVHTSRLAQDPILWNAAASLSQPASNLRRRCQFKEAFDGFKQVSARVSYRVALTDNAEPEACGNVRVAFAFNDRCEL
jgi:hypothetical protein